LPGGSRFDLSGFFDALKELRFGAVYGAPPIFDPDLDRMGHVEVSELNLPPPFIKDINVWNQEFQNTHCEDYPPDSGFDSSQVWNNTMHRVLSWLYCYRGH
jgi:hypothetical protein